MYSFPSYLFRYFLIVLGAINGKAVSAQEDIIQKIVNQPIQRVSEYFASNTVVENTIRFAGIFGKEVITFPDSLPRLDQVQVLAIDLVFTDYPSGNELKALNSKRLLRLKEKYPRLFLISSIEWRLVRQMEGSIKEKGMEMFHGFVIYYRPLQSLKSMEADLKALKILLEPETDKASRRKRAFLTADTSRTRMTYEIEEYTIIKKLPVNEALSYLGLDPKEKINYRDVDSLYVFEKPPGAAIEKTSLKPPVDSTVLNVLNRKQWKNMLVVADVTGSMYPYLGQLLYWMKQQEDQRLIQQFVFFNDGDRKEEAQKILGQTGGIYKTNSSVYEVVEQLLYKAMTNGTGGAIPENNIESLLAGLLACTGCSQVIMIADNWSPVTDISLLPYLKKPIHIIVCGLKDKVNIDLLNIALATRGSIHTSGTDIDLSNKTEGDIFKIAGYSYVVSGGKIKLPEPSFSEKR